jgi:spoIIIJ-associated protein
MPGDARVTETSQAPETATTTDGEDDLLIREGDIAGDYLERLLDILDYDGDIDMDVENDRAIVAVVGERLQPLVGPQGATLDALQELTRLAVIQQTGTRSRLMLDIGGFRDRRRAELVTVAKNAAARVTEHGAPVHLDPMNPFERKVVHDAVGAIPGVRSESDGEEQTRHVVVHPSD